MIPKGIGDMRSLHGINTSPGPLTEKSLLLRLYKLASQKANLQKKKEWAERQRIQSIRHLVDLQREIGWLKKMAMAKVESPSKPGKAEPAKQEEDQKWNKIPLRY